MPPSQTAWFTELFGHMGPVAWMVLGLLVVLSAATWAAMWDRRKALRSAETGHARLLLLLRDRRDLDRVRDACAAETENPSARVLHAGAREAEALRALGTPASLEGAEARIRIVERACEEARREEVLLLQRRLALLATVGAVAPFIGLFGTVWGIMRSFLEIGSQGSTSLVVVGPGIAEALITTAAGLAAAIPAVMGFNHFQSRVRRMSIRLQGLTDGILNLWEREELGAAEKEERQAHGTGRTSAR